nr:radial spoke head protein 3 homolog isoform X1 [Pogona vitticeps]XP_020665090.1 radial spoke head protein 3 homolog isoform X1 [Pogona vitticeps]XP_020665100.1 radial spoke head protein 3 homolog isoform X1 [Pogona vitticeps]
MTSVILNPDGSSTASRTYSYSSHPRPVPVRKRYRKSMLTKESPDGPVRYGNLMYDRRVVRGNTYAAHTLPWSPEPDPIEIQKQQEAHRKMLARRRAKEESEVHAPEVDDATRRADVQTELYLEEIADRVLEADMECQTDAFLGRKASPFFIPEKTGSDASTQIEEGELFDFDIEVKPVLEVLVGKTTEQALLEVAEEEEMATLRAHQAAYQELRNAEIAELHRLEERERRAKGEKVHRMEQQTATQENQSQVREKIAARAFALQYLSNLVPSVFSSLLNKGFFYDNVHREIEEQFLPYVMGNVEKKMEKRILGRIVTDLLINEVEKRRLDDFAENMLLSKSQSYRKQKTFQFPSQKDDERSYFGAQGHSDWS